MSKAIVVIEFDDEFLDRINTTFDEMLADVTIYNKESFKKQCDYLQRIYRCWIPVKPMPEKKEVVLKDRYFLEDAIKFAALKGFNRCIDEITEGEE